MRKYLAAPLALFAGLAAEQVLEHGGVDWLPAFLAGLLVIAVTLLLMSGRRVAK